MTDETSETKKVKAPIPDELIITLTKAVTMSGRDDETIYTEIVLHEPDLSQVSKFVKRADKEGNFEAMKWLVSVVADMPLIALDKIAVTDYYKAMNYMKLWVTPPDEEDTEGNAGGSH